MKRDPGTKTKTRKGGAMAQDPRFSVAGDAAGLAAQQAQLQKRIAAKGGNAPNLQARLDQVTAAQGQAGAPGQENYQMPYQQPEQMAPQQPSQEEFNQRYGIPENMPQMGQVGGSINQGIQGALGQMGQQFSPQQYQMGYEDQRNRASDTVMSQFNRQMDPQFKRQETDFRQMMSEQGIPEGSKAWTDRYQQQVTNPQSQARQGAMDQSYLTGAAEQQQGWNQAYQGYRLPTEQLAAYSPYYQQQGQMAMQGAEQQFQSGENYLNRGHELGMQGNQYGFQGNESALQRNWQGGQTQQQRQHELELAKRGNQYSLQQIAATPRGGGGGGGLSYDQQLGLIDRNFYNQMVMQGVQGGRQPQGPNAGGAFGQGLVSGAAAGALY